jgi:hypothetical protein
MFISQILKYYDMCELRLLLANNGYLLRLMLLLQCLRTTSGILVLFNKFKIMLIYDLEYQTSTADYVVVWIFFSFLSEASWLTARYPFLVLGAVA